MSATGAADATVLFAVAGGVWFAVAVGFYIWYALALSMVFPRVGVESWRAWVPVLSDAEILRLGGFSPWLVILYFIPVVNIYGIVLRAIASTRVHRRFGYAVGMTVLAIVIPPVWATILAWGRDTAGSGEPQVAPASAGLQVTGPLAQTRVPSEPAQQQASAAGWPAPGQSAQAYGATSGQIAPPPGWYGQAPAAPAQEPIASRPPAFQPPAPEPAVPQWPAPQQVAPAAPVEPVAAAPVPPAVAPEPVAAPLPEPEVPAVSDRAGPGAPTEAPAPSAGAPVSPPPVQVQSTFAPPAPPEAAEPGTDTGTVVVQRTGSPVDVSEDDETVIVPRKRAPQWRLETDEGEQLDLTADKVVLGRRPSGEDEDVQYLALQDGTKTLSKRHAQLSFAGEAWSITDLHSTNGVILIDESGQEEPLEAGQTAAVTDRLLLGKVGVRIVRVDP